MSKHPLPVFALVAVSVVAIAALLGAALTPQRRTPPIMSDGLGPESGAAVSTYLAAARATLDAPDPEAERWALVSFSTHETPEQAAAILTVPRISLVLLHAPNTDGPVDSADVPLPPRGDAGYAPTLRRVASRDVDVAVRTAVAHDQPTIVGAIVRADLPTLRRLQHGDVRAVEALPPDAVWGRFAVRPLLPDAAGGRAP